MFSSDLYTILDVPPHASQAQLKSAYRRQAKLLHPDTGDGQDNSMVRLNWAYAILSDPEQRQLYDQAYQRHRQFPVRPSYLGLRYPRKRLIAIWCAVAGLVPVLSWPLDLPTKLLSLIRTLPHS